MVANLSAITVVLLSMGINVTALKFLHTHVSHSIFQPNVSHLALEWQILTLLFGFINWLDKM